MSSRAEITAKFAKAYVKARRRTRVEFWIRWSRSPGGRVTMLGAGLPQRPGGRQERAGRSQTAPQAAGPEVFLRRVEGAAEGLGGLGWAVRESIWLRRCDSARSAANATMSWSSA